MAEQKFAPGELIEEAISKGGILSIFYFDIMSNQKEACAPALAEIIGKLTHEKGVISAVGEIEEPMEMENMWSSAMEVKIITENFASLMNVAIRYGPIGIEVMKPMEIKMSAGEAQDILFNVSQISRDFAQHVISKMMSEEDKKKHAEQQRIRAELGKKLLEKREEKK